MILYISNDDVRQLVTMADAVTALEAGFAQWGQGGTVNHPRRRLPLPGGRGLNYMAASLPGADSFGTKAYFNLPAGGSALVSLYSISEGRLAALIEARVLGELRTGAASGVATRYLAREDAARVGVIGAGRQARAQLMAMCAVRKIRSARAFSRTAATRERFAREVGAELGIEIVAAASARDAVEGADIVITATHGAEIVLSGDWIRRGVHINAMGANNPGQREVDDATVLKADLLAVDDREQAKLEADEFTALAKAGRLSWERVHELGAVVRGAAPRRSDAGQITLFNSLGIALEDIAFGKLIYDRARERGLGKKLEV